MRMGMEMKMKLVSVRAHILKNRQFDNWESEVEGRWKIEDLRADEGYCNDWISFDSLAWDEKSSKLYIGLTSINNDFFYAYDPAQETFTSLRFRRISDKFDAKFHRSLEIDDDGMIYAATALLHQGLGLEIRNSIFKYAQAMSRWRT